tara:strand:+ start:110 stop:457 length:348 start_codon:yes stop_codon:yes gene_type:complete
MKILGITFTKLNESQITAHLTFSDNNTEFGTIRAMGVSRKQAVFNLCKQGLLSWDLFEQAKSLAMMQKDPRFQSRTFVSRNSVRDQKLADICDDMRCSVAEAVAFLDRDIMPRGW